MTILEFCRNQVFWLIDALRGGKVRKALDVLKKCEDGIWSDEYIADYQANALSNLMTHCMNTVPYYRGVKTLNLKDWPVLSKSKIKENQALFMSSKYKKKSLFKMSTSGSTGTPFTCYQDVGKKRHVNAEVLYYNGKTGYKIGKKIIYFRSIVSEVAKSKLQQFMQNIVLVDCNDLSDEKIARNLKLISKETRGSGAMMMGYCSTLDAFRKYFDKYGYDKAEDCNIIGIVGGSEMFQDVTRDGVEKAFKCKGYSRYANEENGFIGQDDEERNVFIPNRADYIVEILKIDSDEPADDGEVGRVVITDLYNFAMPMVRYDTGDVGAWITTIHNGKKRRAIGKFCGRVVDMIFDCKGNQISPHAITNAMWEYQVMRQFQFIQKGKAEYVIKINPLPEVILEPDIIIRTIKSVVGNDAVVTIEIVDEIPILASGKRRYIVNEMKKI